MKWLIIFGKPHFQVTIEEGNNYEDCLKNALAKFNKEFCGSGTLEDIIYSNAEHNARNNSERNEYDWKFTLSRYDWDVKTYLLNGDEHDIEDATLNLIKILEDIKAKTIEKTKAMIKENKMKQYEQLKKELEIK